MKFQTQILLLLFFGLLSLTTISCEENEIDLADTDPYFKVKFINQDSIDKLTVYKATINTNITAITNELAAINKLIEEGDDTDYSATISSLKAEKKLLEAELKAVTSRITLIKSGKIQPTKIEGEEGISEITYTDSLTLFKFPLNSNADISKYIITIADATYTLEAVYSREIVFNERTTSVVANDFNITSTTGFSSINIYQRDSTNYSSHEATVTLSF